MFSSRCRLPLALPATTSLLMNAVLDGDAISRAMLQFSAERTKS